ncbi:MAG: hypothetical protein R3F04_16680 [Lysobacteraceae bacterium]
MDDAALTALLERLEDSELDDYTDIITLIGIGSTKTPPGDS